MPQVESDLRERVATKKYGDIAQPDTLPVSLPTHDKAIMAHCRVADRIPKTILAITAAEMLYHELDDHLDQSVVRDLDAPLYVAEQMREVYSQMKRAMKEDLLAYEPPQGDRHLIAAPTTTPEDIVGIFNSTRINDEITMSGDRLMLNQHLSYQSESFSAPPSAPSSENTSADTRSRSWVRSKSSSNYAGIFHSQCSRLALVYLL